MIKQYKVGRLSYRVNFVEGGKNDEELIPSSKPFETDLTDEPLIFELTVDDAYRPAEAGEEIGQFDCGGNNHGVYQRKDGGYEIRITNYMGQQCCLLCTTSDFSKGWVALNGGYSMRNFGLNNSLMIMYAFSAAHLNTMLFHASVIREKGYGYLFLGVSGTGKSTHTGNWLKYIPGTDLMNDDNPVVRFIDGQAIVFGSPWSGKTPCYRSVHYPLGGIVLLSQAPYNKIERLNGIYAYAALMESISGKRWDERIADGLHQTENALASSIPVWHLECLPDEEAAILCNETITP